MSKKPNELTITEAHELLSKKDISSRELTKACFDEIEKKDGEIHAYISLTKEEAYIAADKADQKISAGDDIGALEGIPMALKDNILLKDTICTAGSKMLENYKASYDATVVEKLKNAGAVFLGKANMDEFAMGSSTENSAFKTTKNPHDTQRVPGGSSGGSAAAVAANECIYALGSDTGGSIRQPASFCGVAGLKPTYGAVSRHGLMAMASSLDQVGSLAKNVDDAFEVFKAICGKDKYDGTVIKKDFDFSKKTAKKIKIGVPKEYFIDGMDKETESIIKNAISKFEKEQGAEVVEVSLPYTDYALATYYLLVPAEVSANLSRFDGIRYGFSERKGAKDLFEIYSKSRGQGIGKEVRRRIILGAYVLSAGYYDAYYLKAQKIRTKIIDDFRNVFESVDAIFTPTCPFPAFKFGEKADAMSMYLSDVFTVPVNIAGVPALSLNAGFKAVGDKKLPVGIQVIGKWFDEPKLYHIAKKLEETLKIS
jgi:aspartyl-tRNA(Asn)/glutamyl-tRNA(Gln) amidotransferase subunit A